MKDKTKEAMSLLNHIFMKLQLTIPSLKIIPIIMMHTKLNQLIQISEIMQILMKEILLDPEIINRKKLIKKFLSKHMKDQLK
jgi:predicted class III extradiol MEMO1 family dioxygenase